MCPLISIIIPARNDAVALQRTLDHLQQLTGIAGVEILVAASGDLRSTERAVAGRAQLDLAGAFEPFGADELGR